MFEKIRRLLLEPAVAIDFTGFMFALVVSLLIAGYVMFLYQAFFGAKATGSQVHRSFPLLSPAITALFIAVQFSLPLSLGLLGALSIIRFRTPIKEPEEVGFIMLMVASSVVCATFQFLLLFALLGVVTVGLVVQHLVRGADSIRQDGVIVVTLDPSELDQRAAIGPILQKHLKRLRLQSLSFDEDQSVIHYSFTNADVDQLTTMDKQVREVEGVRSLNIFLNKQGVLF